MRQELVFDDTHFADHLDEVEEGDQMEDRLNEAEPWEIAFEEGERLANEEMIDEWDDEDF